MKRACFVTAAVLAALFASACSDDGDDGDASGGSAGSGGDGGASASGGTSGSGGGAASGGAAGSGSGGTSGAAGDAGAAGAGGSGACSSSAYEPNGVLQIRPTACGKAEPWVLGFGDWETRTRQFGDATGSGANTIVEGSGQVRMTVKAEDSDCEGETDHGQALSQGYMCSPNDWYNYELTGYLKLDVAAPNETEWDFTLYGGGGRHTGSGPPTGCLGSSIKGSYDYKQKRVRFSKESWHVNYDWKPWVDVPDAIDLSQNLDQWVGIKVLRYEFTKDGERGQRNELWLDVGGVDASGAPVNAWKLVASAEDHPNAESWGDDATSCGAPADDQIMFWGGPWATFRWDDTSAKLRLASVREIVPP